jgi:hypothetical protein
MRRVSEILRRRWIYLYGSALIFICLGTNVVACTESGLIQIGRDFEVQVLNQGQPVAGLAIELSTYPVKENEERHSVLMVRTDTAGLAQFYEIRPGLYYVGIKHSAFPYSNEIKVMRHPPKVSVHQISFEWPGWKPLSTQTIAGILTGRARTNRPFVVDNFHEPVYATVQGATLVLSKAVSEETVDLKTTDSSGKFEFKNIPPGFYLLRVETPNFIPSRWVYPVDGYVPIEVDPSAKFSNLDLELDNAICGELAWGRPEEAN